MLDRFDLIVEMGSVGRDELLAPTASPDDWFAVRHDIAACQSRQACLRGKLNSEMQQSELEACAQLGKAEKLILARAMDKFSLSARTVHRVLRVARTIADLRDGDEISQTDLLEAIAFRRSCSQLGGSATFS